jgi:hypothetical protein
MLPLNEPKVMNFCGSATRSIRRSRSRTFSVKGVNPQIWLTTHHLEAETVRETQSAELLLSRALATMCAPLRPIHVTRTIGSLTSVSPVQAATFASHGLRQ